MAQHERSQSPLFGGLNRGRDSFSNPGALIFA